MQQDFFLCFWLLNTICYKCVWVHERDRALKGRRSHENKYLYYQLIVNQNKCDVHIINKVLLLEFCLWDFGIKVISSINITVWSCNFFNNWIFINFFPIFKCSLSISVFSLQCLSRCQVAQLKAPGSHFWSYIRFALNSALIIWSLNWRLKKHRQ